MKEIVIAKDYDTKWYTHHKIKELVLNPEIIKLVKNLHSHNNLRQALAIEEHCEYLINKSLNLRDSNHLTTITVPSGTRFDIKFHHGKEIVVFNKEGEFLV